MKLIKTTVCFVLAVLMVATLMLTVSADSNFTKTQKESLPAYYSSVEKGYVTSVKNQYDTRACWAYAATAACESSMIIHNGYDTSLDLSELLTVYASYNKNEDKMGMFDSNQYNNNYVMEGNRSEYTMFALANQQGVVKESANHGQFSSEKLLFDFSNVFKVCNPETMYAYNEAYVTDAYKIDFSKPDLIKHYIIKFGAGTAEYCYAQDYYNNETGAYYCYDEANPDHVIAIVGWDDNYPKENCTVNGHTPENNGAWLIKNSLGTEHGNDGYNWVSYEDTSIITFPAVFYKLTTNGTYTNTYQYDDLCGDAAYWDETHGATITGCAYTANVFTAQNDNETLEAVSFYTPNYNLDYKIEIYTDIKDESDPTKGDLKATLKAEDLTSGYHTIKLDKAIALNKGEKFSIVINLKDEQNSECKIHISIDGMNSTKGYKIMSNGESFFSLDGENWTDIYNSFNQGNFRIKAFTNSDEVSVELKDYYESADNKSREELISELKATLAESSCILENPIYEEDLLYAYFIQFYTYSKQACENSDIFLATELCELNSTLMYYYNEITGTDNNTEPSAPDDDYFTDTCGDVNGDERVNIKDATLIQKHIAMLVELTVEEELRADAYADGEVNVKDSTAIQKYVAGLEISLPVIVAVG